MFRFKIATYARGTATPYAVTIYSIRSTSRMAELITYNNTTKYLLSSHHVSNGHPPIQVKVHRVEKKCIENLKQ